jgi:glycosyltransferase involved in cell wall biosynthesis
MRCRRILLVNNSARGSGAGVVAWNLLNGFLARGHEAWYAVDEGGAEHERLLRFREAAEGRALQKVLFTLADRLSPLAGRIRGARWGRDQIRRLARPSRIVDYLGGREEFDFPASRRVVELLTPPPDILHLHDLLGHYFDLRGLPALSKQLPVVLTLHNAWLLTGHCSHPGGCERWRTGCGSCPDLAAYPPVRVDATAANLEAKGRIYEGSRLFVAAPSRWLMDMAKQSVLARAVSEWRVIPNGVDLSIFHPADRARARAALGLEPDRRILLIVARGGPNNLWKDFPSLYSALRRLEGEVASPLVVVLGRRDATLRVGSAEIRFLPAEEDRRRVASFYQAADLYIHPSRADTFPNVVLEALACGTPVVATDVGGIREQVRSLWRSGTAHAVPPGSATGVMVPPNDPGAMAEAIGLLTGSNRLREELGRNASVDAAARFALDRQIESYLGWYEEIIHSWSAHMSS